MRRRRSGRLHVNAEINVVSLIDVMMLLLVIFMIAAPMMQGGVDVKLPVAVARPLDQKSPMVITIDARGTIFVGRDRLSRGEFQAAFKSLIGDGAERGVTIRADRAASVQMLMGVLAVVRDAGVTNIGMVTESPR